MENKEDEQDLPHTFGSISFMTWIDGSIKTSMCVNLANQPPRVGAEMVKGLEQMIRWVKEYDRDELETKERLA